MTLKMAPLQCPLQVIPVSRHAWYQDVGAGSPEWNAVINLIYYTFAFPAITRQNTVKRPITAAESGSKGVTLHDIEENKES